MAVLIAAAVAVPSAQAKGGFFGLNYSAKGLGSEAVRKLDKSGAKTVRWTFFWPRIEKSRGDFDWSAPDRVVGGLAARGIRVLPTLYGSPHWVEGSHHKPPMGSRRAREVWRRFVRAAVNRYGPGGSYWAAGYRSAHPGNAVLPIRRWQIWNEPNLESHWKPHPSPGRYARLLKRSHRAISNADPRARVVFAGMPATQTTSMPGAFSSAFIAGRAPAMLSTSRRCTPTRGTWTRCSAR